MNNAHPINHGYAETRATYLRIQSWTRCTQRSGNVRPAPVHRGPMHRGLVHRGPMHISLLFANEAALLAAGRSIVGALHAAENTTYSSNHRCGCAPRCTAGERPGCTAARVVMSAAMGFRSALCQWNCSSRSHLNVAVRGNRQQQQDASSSKTPVAARRR